MFVKNSNAVKPVSIEREERQGISFKGLRNAVKPVSIESSIFLLL